MKLKPINNTIEVISRATIRLMVSFRSHAESLPATPLFSLVLSSRVVFTVVLTTGEALGAAVGDGVGLVVVGDVDGWRVVMVEVVDVTVTLVCVMVVEVTVEVNASITTRVYAVAGTKSGKAGTTNPLKLALTSDSNVWFNSEADLVEPSA